MGGRPQRFAFALPEEPEQGERRQRERVGGRGEVEGLADVVADVAQHAEERLDARWRRQVGATQRRAGQHRPDLCPGERVAKHLEPPLGDEAAAAVRDHVQRSGRARQPPAEVEGVQERADREGRVVEDEHLSVVGLQRVVHECPSLGGRREFTEDVGRTRERAVDDQQRPFRGTTASAPRRWRRTIGHPAPPSPCEARRRTAD